MKHWLRVVVLLLTGSVAVSAATVTGNLVDITDTVPTSTRLIFEPLGVVFDDDDNLVLRVPMGVMTDDNGDFSVVLKLGAYRVRVISDYYFTIDVPNDAGTYTLRELVTSDTVYAPGPLASTAWVLGLSITNHTDVLVTGDPADGEVLAYDDASGKWVNGAGGGGGGSGNSFETQDAPAGTDPVASSATDTLTWTVTGPLTLTGDSATDTMAFAWSGTFADAQISASSVIQHETALEAVLDLQDQQGAVTDAQVPDDITIDLAATATTANAGDSATAFFSAGTIEHERGGLEADVSAYTGLVGIDGGATVEANTISEVFTALLGTTGTPSSSTYYRGDNTWATPSGGAAAFDWTFTESAMGALAIDTGEIANTKSVAADDTFTFATTPSAGQMFGLILTETGGVNRTITIPSSYTHKLNDNITTFTLFANQTIWIRWYYDGTTYRILFDNLTIDNLPELLTIDLAADPIMVWDSSAGGTKKFYLNNVAAWDAIQVGGVDVSDININSTTPAAPAGGKNIIMQTSGSAPTLMTGYLDLTSDFDFGGASSFALPNGASGTTDAAGEVFLDVTGDITNMTGPVIQVHDGTATGYLFPTALPLAASQDNFVPTYDATGKTIQWEAVPAGGEGSVPPVHFLVRQAVIPTTSTAVMSANQDGVLPYISLDGSSNNPVKWHWVAPADFVSLTSIVIRWRSAGTSGNVEWECAVTAISDGDAVESATADTTNAATAQAVPGTAGQRATTTITLTNDDAMAPGDNVVFEVQTDGTNDTNNDTRYIVGVSAIYANS